MTTDYHRVERAIRYLEAQSGSHPSLDEVAEHVGLSKYHFQRLFQRWAGVSPKRFLQFLTLGQAKRLLRNSASVLETTWETGLSSPGRLHDLFVSAEAVTPGQYKDLGAGLKISFGIHPSPFGDCLIGATDRGICYLAFVDERGEDAAVDELTAEWPGATVGREPAVTEPLAGRAFDSDSREPLCLRMRGTNFQLKVWDALLRVPAGAAVSYGGLARAIGRPGSSRAVGGAVGANRIAFLIPCHRVLRASGQLGNYRWGSTRKKAMLMWEATR